MTKVENVLEKFGALYAVIVSQDGLRRETLGDVSALPFRGLVDQFFAGADSVGSLVDYLDGAILPQVASQGELVCVLTVLDSGDVAGVFVIQEGDAVAMQLRAEELESELIEAARRDALTVLPSVP